MVDYIELAEIKTRRSAKLKCLRLGCYFEFTQDLGQSPWWWVAMVWREVLPYATKAEIDEGNTRTGYDISFTRYFYRLPLLRTLAKIRADIEALERETEGLPDEILEEVKLA